MTSAQEKLEAIDSVIADYTAQRKALAEKVGQEIVSEVTAPFFTYPGVTAVSWTQYTPYFNDGDPCVFRVGWPGVQFGLDPDNDDSDEYDGSPGYDGYDLKSLLTVDERRDDVPSYYGNRDPQEWYDYVDGRNARREQFLAAGVTQEALEALSVEYKKFQVWLEAHEDFLEDAFGDHVRITFRQDGTVDVDDYDHD